MGSQSLEGFVASVNGESHLRVEYDYGDGFVRLRTSEAERRQAAQDIRNTEGIVLELLRNARDAHASRIYVAMAREGSKRTLVVIDNGDGIPEAMHEHVFEPRVTSKLDTNHMDAWGMHGRGMALYSIRVNAEQAFVAASEPSLGCAIRVDTDVARLPERTDQSSFPTFELGESGSVNVRGPRNILRTVCEFAIESRDACEVFVGSPVEIAAAIYGYGTATLSAIDRAFCKNVGELPLVKRLAATADPDTLAETAASLGLDISGRSARRIIDGEVAEPEAVLERIALVPNAPASTRQGKAGKAARAAGARSFKLGKEDAQLLASALGPAFADIAERYYLDGSVEPSVRASKDRITITLPIIQK